LPVDDQLYYENIYTFFFFYSSTFGIFRNAVLIHALPDGIRAYEKLGKMKKVHIASVIVVMLLPLTPIITSMAKFAADVQERATNKTPATELFVSGGLGYTNVRFPPLLCAGSDGKAVFYSTVLPLDLALATGCTMLLIIILYVHRVRPF